jgi:hypothetical protein
MSGQDYVTFKYIIEVTASAVLSVFQIDIVFVGTENQW